MGSLFAVSLEVCEYLKWCSIKNVARSFLRMSNEVHSNVCCSSTTLRASVPVLGKDQPFFTDALRSQSGLKRAPHRTVVSLLAYERTYILK